jgi:hypothetical protein
MRKTILCTLAVLALAFDSRAQITITGTDASAAINGAVRTTYMTFYDSMPLNLGSASASLQTWNFGNVTGTVTSRDTTRDTFYPPAGFPAAAQFPAATQAQVIRSVVGNIDSTAATYFQISNSGVYILGIATLVKNPPAADELTVIPYSTPAKFIPLPATYGTSSSSSDTLPYDVGGGIVAGAVTNRTYRVNGFGTLTFPNGRVSSALRVDATTELLIVYQGIVFLRTYEHDLNFVTQDLSQVYFTDLDTAYVSGTTNVLHVKYQIRTGTTTAIGKSPAFSPTRYSLEQNYPNPFNPSTTIQYDLPQKSSVSLVVYNSLGQQVASLVDGEEEVGSHAVRLDGSKLASGVYYYRLAAGNFVATKKLVLMK